MTVERQSDSTAERRFELLDQLREAELRAASSHVALVIGHIIGTPLNVIAGRASMIRENPGSERNAENARRIEEQVAALARRVQRLLEHLTAPEPDVNPRPVADILSDALELYELPASKRSVRLIVATNTVPTARIDATIALIVLAAALSIATKLPDPGSVIEIRALPLNDERIVFEVSVPSMHPPAMRLDSLEPPPSGGTGDPAQIQVLSVCSAIARRRGGYLEVIPFGDDGATIRFECPRV